ncbi:ankyrin, partial [Viridothelium virens]
MTVDYVVVSIFRYLLDCGSDPFLADNNDVSPYDRAWEGILKSGGLAGTAGEMYSRLFPSSEPLSSWGLTTLHKIVLGLNMRDLSEALSDPEIVKDINTQDAKGRTPLWWSIDQLGPHCGSDIDHLKSLEERNQHALPRVQMLLSAGADPNIADIKGEPPLRNAISPYSLNIAMVRLLAAHGADLAYRNTQAMSALHVAARWLDSPLDLLDLLASAPDWKRNLNHPGGYQSRSPLHIAIAMDATPTALWLLRHGADPNPPRRTADPSPLLAALRRANFAVVRALLAAGADLCSTDCSSGIPQTVLHCAAAAPNTAIIDLLASRRAARGVILDADIFAWLARGWWPSDAPGDNTPESQGRGFARDAYWRLLNTRTCERCALDAGRGVTAPVGLCPVGLEWGSGWAGRREEDVGSSEEEYWEQKAEGKRWVGRMMRLGLLEKGEEEGEDDSEEDEDEEEEEEEEEEERGRRRCRRGEKLRLPPHGPHLEDDESIRHLWYDVGVPKPVPGQKSGRELQTRVGEKH